MYASRTGDNNGYGVRVEKVLVKTHFGQKYSLTWKNGSPPQFCYIIRKPNHVVLE
jgi:hypothetical protein